MSLGKTPSSARWCGWLPIFASFWMVLKPTFLNPDWQFWIERVPYTLFLLYYCAQLYTTLLAPTAQEDQEPDENGNS